MHLQTSSVTANAMVAHDSRPSLLSKTQMDDATAPTNTTLQNVAPAHRRGTSDCMTDSEEEGSSGRSGMKSSYLLLLLVALCFSCSERNLTCAFNPSEEVGGSGKSGMKSSYLLLLLVALSDSSGQEGKHSLFYLYTIQSKSSTDRIYEFRAVTLLDDRQIDSYSSTDGVRTPKQDWMTKMKEREWKEGTDKLKYDGQQLNKILDNQMKTFRHSESDGHTLQWRVGCEGEEHSDGSVSVLDCINEYGYDGQSLISYDWTSRKWSVPVSQAKEMEEEWNAGRGQNAVQRCEECEHWLEIYLQYNTTETKPNEMDVHVFAKRSVSNSTKLTLTCLATGFYPNDVEIKVRKFTTSLPEHLLTSSGVRPNDDGSYQMRKSVEIQEDNTADYNCYVTHSSISTPVIKQWEVKCSNCQRSLSGGEIVGVAVGVMVALLAVLGGIFYFCNKKRKSRGGETHLGNGELPTRSGSTADPNTDSGVDAEAEPVGPQKVNLFLGEGGWTESGHTDTDSEEVLRADPVLKLCSGVHQKAVSPDGYLSKSH